jgi:hypothetical protein
MLNFLLSFLLTLNSLSVNTVAFEGKIEVVHESLYNTSYFTYFVKNNNVRIDKFDSNHSIEQSLLINLENRQVYILSPTKKMYTQLDVHESNNSNSDNYTILKTENSRMVGDYQCYQWRVKNKERNTEIAYWVSQNNFYFFEDLVKLINNTDNTYEFFGQIPETQGFFPMLSVERTLLRREKSRTYVVNISDKKVSDDLFQIPSNYELVIR